MSKRKSLKRLKQLQKMTIDANEIRLNSRKFTTSEIGRGIGEHKIDKGKGSYNRKKEKNKKYQMEDY